MADLRVESLLGSNVRCQLLSGQHFDGELFGADGTTSLVFRVASDAGTRSYRIVSASQIVSLEASEEAPAGLESSSEPWGQPLPAINNDKLAVRLDATIREAERQAEKIGVGVSVEAQLLFNALSKTLPCRWNGETIIVMDEVRIEKPYGIESCSGGSAASLRRVQKVVEGEKRKLAKTGGSV